MKNKSNIQVHLVGCSSNEVTGSCVWIETEHRQILVECGLHQSESDTLKEYKINNASFDFKPKSLDYVFINHCHADHIGLVPLLYRRGCKAKLLLPKNSTEIAEILMRDSAKIMSVDAKSLSTTYGRGYLPIYESKDVDTALSYSSEYPFNEIVVLDEYVKFRFVPSGHILNSAQLELWITEGNVTKKLVYTSDLGNVHLKKKYVAEFAPISKANLFIGESTYGSEKRIASSKTRKKDLEKMKATIERCCTELHGRVLIPVFANDRCQNMLTVLYEMFAGDMFFRIPVIVDSPMACRVCDAYSKQLSGEDAELWKRVSQWDKIKYVSDAAESKAWQKTKGPAIILASSGMLTNGRSRSWCRILLPDSRNCIIFCGYSVDNSLASIIKSGKLKRIKLSGEYVSNKCNVVDLHSFTSHMQRDSLIRYYGEVSCDKICLLHGEEESKKSLSEDLRKELSKNNKTSRVVCAQKNMVLTI